MQVWPSYTYFQLKQVLIKYRKTFKYYEGLRHGVYNEVAGDRAKVLADIKSWVDEHL